MNREFENYINEIVEGIGVKGKKRKKIREDLYLSLMEKQQVIGKNDPYFLLGSPNEVIDEFRKNLDIKNNVNECSGCKQGYEYVSKTKVFGIPLVHVNNKPMGVAKGVFSLGSIAIGIFSFGGISFGVFSFGGLSLAILISFGGVALSGMLSIGGVALSYIASFGGAAIAKHIAFGGYARANIAIGGVAKGIIAVFNQDGTGQYLFKNPVKPDEVLAVIKQVYPSIGRRLLNFIKILL